MGTFLTILGQLLIALPVLIASITSVTGIINGLFNIENAKTKQIISWIVAVICGVAAIFTGAYTFGLGWIDYVIGGAFGLVAGGIANKFYDIEIVHKIIDLIYFLFGHGDTVRAKRAAKLEAEK